MRIALVVSISIVFASMLVGCGGAGVTPTGMLTPGASQRGELADDSGGATQSVPAPPDGGGLFDVPPPPPDPN